MIKINTIVDSININRREYIYTIISTICFTLFWSLDLKVLSYIVFLTYMIPIIFFNTSKLIIIYYFMIPNISLFKMSKTSIALSSILILAIIFKFILRRDFKVNIKIIMGINLYILISTITYLLADDSLSALIAEIRISLDIFMIVSSLYLFRNKLDMLFQYICKSYIYGCFVTAICGIMYCILKGTDLNGFRLEAINSDPNYFSLCLAFSISLLLVNIHQNNRIKFDTIIITLFIVFGLMSLSRGFLLCMIPNIIFCIYIYLH